MSQVPPTHLPTTRISAGFQALVDTYGVPRYREINPGDFAIVLFAFLFGAAALINFEIECFRGLEPEYYACSEEVQNAIQQSTPFVDWSAGGSPAADTPTLLYERSHGAAFILAAVATAIAAIVFFAQCWSAVVRCSNDVYAQPAAPPARTTETEI